MCVLIGCQRVSDSEWQRRYDDARHKLWYGSFQEAYQQANRNFRKAEGTAPAWAWRFLLLETQALQFQGKPKEALVLLQREVPSDLPLDVRARKKILLGDTLCRLGNLQEAKPILSEVESLIAGKEPVLQAELALTQGRCRMLTDRAAALQYFNAATGMARGTDEFIEATAILNAGFVLLDSDHPGEAIEKLQQGLEATASPLLQEKMRGNIGFCYSQLGDWKKAISFSQQAESTAAKIGNDSDREKWLIDLGKEHFATREFQTAEKYYLQALSIAQQRNEHDNIALCFHNLALVALKRNDPDTAEDYRAKGEAQNSKREQLHLALDTAEIAAARKQWSEAARLFQDQLPRAAKDAVLLSMIQRDLGKIYGKEGKIRDANQMFLAGIRTAEQAVAKLKRPEYRMSFMDQDPFYDSYIQFLVEQNKPEESLRIAERSRSHVLAAALENGKARDSVTAVPTMRGLVKQRGQTILAYSLTDEESFLWVITPSKFKLCRHLPGHGDLFRQIEAFNHEIQDRRSIEVSPAGRRLYESLIQPAEKLIPPRSSVVIVPSKVLSLVNFEALIVPGPPAHYWIDDVDIQVTGSVALFARARPVSPKKQPGIKELLALGAPIQADPDFPTLKHAAEEMQRVQSHFSRDQVTMISGPAATPEAYRASNPGSYRLLHFDTHAVASDLSPLESAVILSRGRDSYGLLASEIKDIPLRADLVTISACYGAGTRWYQGEGLVGLAWAFLHAGAHQVVGALWEVDEASSPQLMDDFYGELAKGKSVAEALRAAKLKMRQPGSSYSSPYFWASLQVYTGA